MFTKILYPTDFSDVAMKALKYILGLKGAGVQQAVLLRVINEKRIECIAQGVVWSGKSVSEFQEEIYQDFEEKALKEMEPVKSELEKAGIDVKVRVERGIPQSKILEVEQEENPNALILGSHGRSNIKEIFLGSVSEYVIRHCRGPVIVIKR